MSEWSDWLPFPDLRNEGTFQAPEGPGVGEVHNKRTGEYVVPTASGTLRKWMRSLLPPTVGNGDRHNMRLRQYNLENAADLEYRTIACSSRTEAMRLRGQLCKTRNYLF